MIRRHPWRTLAVAALAAGPLVVWAIAAELWWKYQGQQAWGRP